MAARGGWCCRDGSQSLVRAPCCAISVLNPEWNGSWVPCWQYNPMICAGVMLWGRLVLQPSRVYCGSSRWLPCLSLACRWCARSGGRCAGPRWADRPRPGPVRHPPATCRRAWPSRSRHQTVASSHGQAGHGAHALHAVDLWVATPLSTVAGRAQVSGQSCGQTPRTCMGADNGQSVTEDMVMRWSLAACRTWSVESENRPQRGQFLPDLQPHSPAMGQKDGKKWTAAADLQPTISKPDRLLVQCSMLGGTNQSDAFGCRARRKPQR